MFDSGFAGTTYGDGTGPVFSAVGNGCAGLSGPLRAELKSLQVMSSNRSGVPTAHHACQPTSTSRKPSCVRSRGRARRNPFSGAEGHGAAEGLMCHVCNDSHMQCSTDAAKAW